MSYISLTRPSKGGTGVVNDNSETISIEGNYPLTINLSGVTNVTSPTDGILVTTADAPLVTGQILISSGSGVNPSVWLETVNNGILSTTSGGTPAWLTTANNGVLVTDGTGAPSIGSVLPSAVQGNITTLGTIAAGTWNGSIVSGQYGGTGVNNAGRTITLGGNISTVGSFIVSGSLPFTTEFTVTGNTNVTLPTTGTLATTSQLPTFPVSLANGGTGASLTASNGGIIYSTATAMAVLNTANNGVLITSGTGIPGISPVLPAAVQGNITTLGTIAAGTWNGSIVSGQYGGTGVNNAGRTITLGGNFATSGAFSTTLTVTGATNVTLPTTGTLATTSQLPTFPVSLANGGTQASLTASNGGIIYSTATTMAVLAGTVTAGQMLRSGASGAPSWSNAVYPANTNGNEILFSLSSNVITGIPTANNGILITSAAGVPSIGTTLPAQVQNNITSIGGGVGSLTIDKGLILRRTSPGAYPYTVLATDFLVAVNTSAARSIVLPAAAGNTGKFFKIKDETGTANTNNITVTVTGAGTIDGRTSIVMNQSYSALEVYSNGTQWFIS